MRKKIKRGGGIEEEDINEDEYYDVKDEHDEINEIINNLLKDIKNIINKNNEIFKEKEIKELEDLNLKLTKFYVESQVEQNKEEYKLSEKYENFKKSLEELSIIQQKEYDNFKSQKKQLNNLLKDTITNIKNTISNFSSNNDSFKNQNIIDLENNYKSLMNSLEKILSKDITSSQEFDKPSNNATFNKALKEADDTAEFLRQILEKKNDVTEKNGVGAGRKKTLKKIYNNKKKKYLKKKT